MHTTETREALLRRLDSIDIQICPTCLVQPICISMRIRHVLDCQLIVPMLRAIGRELPNHHTYNMKPIFNFILTVERQTNNTIQVYAHPVDDYANTECFVIGL